jgi:excisionase family DNA binding protein
MTHQKTTNVVKLSQMYASVPDMSQLLTASQAAHYFQVSRQTLVNWEKSGKIQTYRIGGIVRYVVDNEKREQQNAKKNK